MATSLVVTFYNSATFQRFFGTNGEVGRVYKLESEWGYRHAFSEGKIQGEMNLPYSSAEEHPSYYNIQKSQTRFFGASDTYQ